MALVIGVGKERAAGEARVSLVPDQVGDLRALGAEVVVEPGAGAAACFSDGGYASAGARLVPEPEFWSTVDILSTVGRPPREALRPGLIVVGMLNPFGDPGYARELAAAGVTAVSLDGLPRTLSRAQTMDALTSQANVAGYKAVLVAANAFGRYFPMLVTAAGTVRPARVLVLGAGVAGLQAMGTARRLGAIVTGYDIRPEARADVESVGARFLDLDEVAGAAAAGGYARALDAAEQTRQRGQLAARLTGFDVVIATALVPGRRPPLLIGEEDVKALGPGSVIVDLAAGPEGGNVALSRPGETVVTDECVVVIGAANLAATVPTAASAAYSRNVTALLRHLLPDGAFRFDPSDEIQAGVVITHDGRIVHSALSTVPPSTAKEPAP